MAQEPRNDDPTQLIEWYAHSDAVCARVKAQWPGVPPDLIQFAFVDALLQLSKKQVVHDPQRADLVAFLAGATASHVRDYHRSETARKRRERKTGLAYVAVRESPARQILNEIVEQEDAARVEARLAQARAAIARTDEERAFLALWEDDVSDRTALAGALGVSHRSPAEQETAIERTRNRLNKRLERLRNQLRREEDNAP